MFVPVGDKILVRRSAPQTQTEGDIIIPEKAREVKPHGVVVTIGNQVKEIASGDTVYFGDFAGTNVKLGTEFGYDPDDKFIVIEEKDVLGVLK